MVSLTLGFSFLNTDLEAEELDSTELEEAEELEEVYSLDLQIKFLDFYVNILHFFISLSISDVICVSCG